MWKPILAGTAALVITGSSLAYAQYRPGPEGPRWRPTVEDRQAFGEARLAALKAGLALTPDQEKSWPAFEQAAREFTRVRIQRLTEAQARASGDARRVDPAELMQRRASALTESGTALKKLGDATGPLYSSLDEAQKWRFSVLGRSIIPGLQGFGDRGPRGFRMHRTENEGGIGIDRSFEGGMDRAVPVPRMIAPVRGEERL